MSEEILPKGILSRAFKVSKEYAWKPKDITNVLNSANDAGLACLGGEIWIEVIDDGAGLNKDRIKKMSLGERFSGSFAGKKNRPAPFSIL